MEDNEIEKKITFKKDLVEKLTKKIAKSKISSIIIHVVLFLIIAFLIKFFSSKIDSESFFDFLSIGYVQNGIIILLAAILIFSAKNNSQKDKDYLKKLQKEISNLEGEN
ncbi:hypothetical protein [uncultured Aquimarina sp.]|uniref:hypothetical protein n=1 Tax=uncultured Aquimarina sp. TaxID=575652 RepID=UPI00261FE3A0|nr:hypothetical protein [uncultured Aquimarina sp.]